LPETYLRALASQLVNHMVELIPHWDKVNHMVEHELEPLDRIFRALADPTRRAMLRRLSNGARNIGELAEPFEMSFAAASKHVKVLELAGLLIRRVEGRTHVCELEPKPMAQASRWLAFYERYWNSRFDALDVALTSKPKKK
jgi:DNA-binding transcriptional ArsR family regulator